jgi:hypothetical protein
MTPPFDLWELKSFSFCDNFFPHEKVCFLALKKSFKKAFWCFVIYHGQQKVSVKCDDFNGS